jgi:signal transduction histidine kinase
MNDVALTASPPQIAVISNQAISRLLSSATSPTSVRFGPLLSPKIRQPLTESALTEVDPWRAPLPTGTTLEELFDLVERAKREWESTVDSLPDLVCLLDQAGRIIRANRIVEEWDLGRVEAVRGQSLHELLHPLCQTPTCYLAALSQQVIDQVIQGEPLDQVVSDPILSRHLQFHAHPVLDRNQISTHTAVVVVRDVTERQRVEQERERLIADLDAYAHTVAHDLKNPVGLVVGYAEFLVNEWRTLPPDEALNCVQTIARVGHKLDDIIDALLLFAEVQDAQVKVRSLAMGDVVAETLDRVANLIEQYHAEVIVPDSWPTVIGHRQWLEEVWVNYLSNALKYGGRPPRVELGSDVQPDGAIRFWVRDNGRGITPANQPRLFTRFARASSGRGQGHGLGLSIVQRIVEKLGGRIGVESDPETGQGSLFYFTLPAAA